MLLLTKGALTDTERAANTFPSRGDVGTKGGSDIIIFQLNAEKTGVLVSGCKNAKIRDVQDSDLNFNNQVQLSRIFKTLATTETGFYFW